MLRGMRLTLGLGELGLLNAGLDGLVELGIEGGLRRDIDLVVRSHVLLDGLAAIVGRQVSKQIQNQNMTRHEAADHEGLATDGEENTNIPAAIALL